MLPVFGHLDLQDAASVRDALHRGASANRDAPCRDGSIDRIRHPGRLIATGDLHDNPLHMARLLEAAGMTDPDATPKAHLTLHEVIHSDRLMNGMDFSYRALVRIAAVKAAFPEHVHTLLANHELSQIVGAGIVKDGIRVVEAFDDGVEHVFGDDAGSVHDAIGDFVRSMPLALRASTSRGDILCAHSLPGPAMMGRFDPDVLKRPLAEDDYAPRTGSAYMMVWGRGYDFEQLEDLVERWGISLFILGHQHVPTGVEYVRPNAIVLNSDHEHAKCLVIDLADPPDAREAVMMAVPV